MISLRVNLKHSTLFTNQFNDVIAVMFNPLTQCYETKDKTSVAAELVESVNSLADILIISNIREQQRIDMKKEESRDGTIIDSFMG